MRLASHPCIQYHVHLLHSCVCCLLHSRYPPASSMPSRLLLLRAQLIPSPSSSISHGAIVAMVWARHTKCGWAMPLVIAVHAAQARRKQWSLRTMVSQPSWSAMVWSGHTSRSLDPARCGCGSARCPGSAPNCPSPAPNCPGQCHKSKGVVRPSWCHIGVVRLSCDAHVLHPPVLLLLPLLPPRAPWCKVL